MQINRFDVGDRMSAGVTVGGLLFLSGQTAAAAGDNLTVQAEAVLEKCRVLLEKYGSDKEHIVSATCYLKDIGEFDTFNKVYDNWVVKGHQSVRTCVEANMASPKVLVEVTLIAALKD